MVRYRPNVAALILNEHGSLLICERSTIRGAWQFPQGGIDPGETTEEALSREIKEEVGLCSHHYEVISRKDGYRYLYPSEVRVKKQKKHGSHGQEQSYFLCKLKPGAPAINIHQTPQEFCAYRWIQPNEFDLDWLPEFKQEVYKEVFKDFFGITL